MSVPYHAWTHRPFSQGGTDPIEIGGAGEWCRVYLTHEQTIGAGDRDIVEFDVVNNPHTSVFGTAEVETGFANSAITILQSGVYAFTYRLHILTLPDVPFTTEMNGIDWDEFLYYERSHNPDAFTGFGLHDSYVFRSDADYGAEPPRLYVIAGVPSGSGSSLVIRGNTGSNRGQRSYMEIVRLTDTTPTGNAAV